MSDTNVFVIKGRLTRDGELKYLSTGTAILTYSIANNTGYGDHKKVNYFDCTMFGKSAEGLSSYLSKGTAVIVTGELQQDRWESDDGTKRSKIKLLVRSLDFAGSKNDDTPSKPASEAPKQANPFASALEGDDDIPF